MLNNEFRLIGTIVSDYVKAGSEKYPKYETKIEVERKTKGKVSTYKLVVLGNNQSVDVSVSLLGKRVIVSGYIDEYKDFINLVVQDVIVIGGGYCAVAATEETVANPASKACPEYDDVDEELQPLEDFDDEELPF